jgi:hypothetical protein
MGQQIAIAQDKADEDAAIEFLRARGEFFAIPRDQEDPEFKPVPLGSCDAQSQILVPESMLDAVLATVPESGEDQDQFAVDFAATSGMFIEWRRTRWLASDLAEAGRFYLAGARGNKSESMATLTRHMSALQRFIRSKYPARSREKYPVYVGPSMWERVEKSNVRIRSSSGGEIKAVKDDK